MGLESFNKRSRPEIFNQLSSEHFDLLVIGGGITGASIFRDAALRGIRVALIEAQDFAFGASGRSSKLIHGGLRYLKNLDFYLTWESCHERNLHISLNKRLVRPWPFLLPLHKGSGESWATLHLGMLLYEGLSGFQNHRFHRFLTREETLLAAPGFAREDLSGGILYYDAIVSDNRWTLEIVKDGVRNGGLAINHTRAIALLKNSGVVSGVIYRDELSGTIQEARASVVVNATGAWADEIRKLDKVDQPDLVKLSKGTHLVFAEVDVPLTVSTIFFSPLDYRPLFLVKRENCFLLGTTDNWVNTGLYGPAPGSTDVEYLLESLRRSMPDSCLDRNKVKFTYSGYRALPVTGTMPDNPSKVTREDSIETAPSGLITVIGGKLTTARTMAIRVLEKILKKIGRSRGLLACRTHKLSIGGTNEETAEGLAYWVRQCPRLNKYFLVLFQRYGLDAQNICASAMKFFLAPDPEHGNEPIRAELEYVCRNEMPCTLEDFIERRAGFLSWSNEKRLKQLSYVKPVICNELDLSEEEFEQNCRDYQEYLKKFHTLPELRECLK